MLTDNPLPVLGHHLVVVAGTVFILLFLRFLGNSGGGWNRAGIGWNGRDCGVGAGWNGRDRVRGARDILLKLLETPMNVVIYHLKLELRAAEVTSFWPKSTKIDENHEKCAQKQQKNC